MKLTKDAFFNPEKYVKAHEMYKTSYYEFDNLIVVFKENSAFGSIKKLTQSQIDDFDNSRSNVMQLTYKHNYYVFHTDGDHPSYYTKTDDLFRFDYHRNAISHRTNGIARCYVDRINNMKDFSYILNSFIFNKPRYLSIVL